MEVAIARAVHVVPQRLDCLLKFLSVVYPRKLLILKGI